MVSKLFVPFGGVHGWLAEITLSRKSPKPGQVKYGVVTESYYVAEPNEGRALSALRSHTAAGSDATLTSRRSLSRNEVMRLGLKPGQVRIVV